MAWLLCWGLPLGLVLLLGPQAAQAQTETLNEAWRWVRYTTASGLPSNDVLDVVETSEGIVWARTAEGLAWYDGFRWHGVGVPEGLPPELESYGAKPDLQGGLLVVTDKRLYQGNEHGFVLIPVEYEGKTLPVNSVVPLDEQTFLINSTDGLYRHRSGVVERFPVPAELEGADQLTRGGVLQTRNGAVWLNSSLGLFRWAGDRWIRRFEVRANMLHEDAGGGILVIVGKVAFEGLWTWTPGQPPQHLEDKTWIVSLDVDQRGQAVVVYTDGRVRLRQDGRWRWLAPVPDLMTNAHVVRFQRTGDLWVGTERGLFLHRGSSTRWTRWGEAGDQVNEILRTRTGDLWLVTNEGVLIRRPDGTSRRITSIDGTALRAVTGLAEDLDGGIWISSGSGFSGTFRWHEGAWQHVGPDEELRATYVHKIAKDRSGRLWFLGQSATFGGTADDPEPGAFVYEAGRFTRWGPDEGLLHGRVYAFAEGPDGARWFGTVKGLSRWKDGQWTHWSKEEGLKSARIFTLAVGPDGRVWFGHQTMGGLGYLDDGEQPRYLTVDDGLIDNWVWNLQFEADGTLWIATQGGLSRLVPSAGSAPALRAFEGSAGTFASFGSSTGLTHPHVWPILPLEDRIYVGSVGGGLYALSLEEAGHPPPVVDVALPVVDAGDVSFRWQAFAYRGEVPPDQIETRYRLDDAPWSPWSTAREAAARNLSAGEHTFTVQARSLFGNVRAAGTTVTFRRSVPFYRHPLFLGALALWALSLVGGGAIHWRNRRRQNALLRESEERLREAQRLAHIGSWESNLSTKTLRWSEEMYHLHGIDPATFTGDPWQHGETLLHPDDRDVVMASIERTAAEGETSEMEFRLVLPDGTERVVMGRATRLLDERGDPSRLVGTVQDITERKQADQVLRRAEQRYRDLFEEAPLMYIITENRDGVPFIIDCNTLFLEAVGYTPDEVLGRPLADFYTPHSRSVLLEQGGYRRALVGESVAEERQLLTREGRLIDTVLHTVPETDETGSVIGTRAMYVDVTQRKQAEEALKRSEQLLRSLIDTSLDWIFTKDRDYRYMVVNQSFAHEHGRMTPEEMIGQDDYELGTPRYLIEGDPTRGIRGFRTDDRAVIERGETVRNPFDVANFRDGTEHIMETVKIPLRDAAGKVMGVLGVARDITERKQAEKEREALIEELEAKNAELERFTYTVSHDLKSPLVTIKGFLGLLEKDVAAGKTEQIEQDLEQINAAADKMQRLLGELLELSRIGRLVHPSENVSLTELAYEAAGLVAGQIDARGVAVEIMPEMPVVFVDRVRLVEVLQNLLDNAVKFMGDQPAPRVQIGAGVEQTEVVCYVHDNGMGIAPAYHEKVFGLFDRLDAGGEGTGIGLALARRIVEVHGGRVWVESEGQGRGSTFWFSLSLPYSEQKGTDAGTDGA